ncbi:DUF624 domain-containing protein [Microbacterium marinilacus]|uniref:DUF624 domain-containing protein n=1 Tax=Microbacterium marinilacus TaxID=415209 RepID=A0ABP7BZ18_9MICO|nr:DUF624 domain-containing protein [Microbacterium marinilacus]MBY0688113.1 DUF624 domain-containing protein [Microbacterium marinilacus]
MTSVTEGMRIGCVWIARLAWLNLLWLLFTLAGLVVLGLFPSTVAGYQIARDLVHRPESREEPMLRRYAALVRASAVRANLAGAVVVAVGLLLGVGLQLAWTADGASWQLPVLGVTVVAAVAFAGGLVHLPFFAAHVEAPPRAIVRASWLYALSHPVGTVLICGAWIGLSFLLGAFPAAAPFFCFAPVAVLTALLDVRGFRVLEQRQAVAAAR